jgi:sRNA-binding carbon storage regulator CsrA
MLMLTRKEGQSLSINRGEECIVLTFLQRRLAIDSRGTQWKFTIEVTDSQSGRAENYVRCIGEKFEIGAMSATVMLTRFDHGELRFGIDAPKAVFILRSELE